MPFLLVHIQTVKLIYVHTENCGSDCDVPWGKISATMTHAVALLSLFSTHFCVGLKTTLTGSNCCVEKPGVRKEQMPEGQPVGLDQQDG